LAVEKMVWEMKKNDKGVKVTKTAKENEENEEIKVTSFEELTART
jgi:hypothetical protein